ncbi:MAG TPA: hypothetical protein VMM15_02335 [Bradyrhizobium sp.]|nr:hypothetical protein [Bradyrhizobium sp.]
MRLATDLAQRAVLAGLLVLTCTSISIAAGSAEMPAEPMAFYVATGAPDSCGPGCNRWIAVEGQIDANAASRFRKFLQRVKDRNLPIYFASPGGNVDQAIAMGGMLRERGAVARVGRTVARECGFEAQDSAPCLKVKQSGAEMHADLWTRGAICVSACPYLILGAPTREIAADAVVGVHSARVVVAFTGGIPTREMRAAATERGRERIDRSLTSYFKRMGAETALLDLAHTVRFEDMHVLTREEIVRFGIDRRDFVETPWTFENAARGVVYKTLTQRDGADGLYRTTHWRLFCMDGERFELDYQRQAAGNALLPTISISNAPTTSLYFRPPPAKRQGVEIWGLSLTKTAFRTFTEVPRFDFTETSLSDGRRLARTTRLSSEGLASALEKLTVTCPAPSQPHRSAENS